MKPFLTTSLGWIDFSKEQKNKVGAVLDLMKFEGMVDELGLGTVRDLLADKMFPGISTIQTRAKYFFYIPYILRDYQLLSPTQKKKITPSNFLDAQEHEIMWELAPKYKEGDGVIGISKKRDERLARRPSAIYWNGIYKFGLIDTGGLGAESFLKRSNRSAMNELLSSQSNGDDVPKDDAGVDFENIFRIKIPYKENWKENLSMDLEKDEAEILKDQIITKTEDTLLALLLEDDNVWESFQAAKNFQEFSKASATLDFPDATFQIIRLAHDFSELMYGSHIYYNKLLQKRKFNNNYHSDGWENWKKDLSSELMLGESFSPNEIFDLGKVNRKETMKFINNFWLMAHQKFSDESTLERMVIGQEFGVKGKKARLHPDKFHDVKEEHWVGLGRFNYRFDQVKNIIRDIRNPK